MFAQVCDVLNKWFKPGGVIAMDTFTAALAQLEVRIGAKLTVETHEWLLHHYGAVSTMEDQLSVHAEGRVTGNYVEPPKDMQIHAAREKTDDSIKYPRHAHPRTVFGMSKKNANAMGSTRIEQLRMRSRQAQLSTQMKTAWKDVRIASVGGQQLANLKVLYKDLVGCECRHLGIIYNFHQVATTEEGYMLINPQSCNVDAFGSRKHNKVANAAALETLHEVATWRRIFAAGVNAHKLNYLLLEQSQLGLARSADYNNEVLTRQYEIYGLTPQQWIARQGMYGHAKCEYERIRELTEAADFVELSERDQATLEWLEAPKDHGGRGGWDQIFADEEACRKAKGKVWNYLQVVILRPDGDPKQASHRRMQDASKPVPSEWTIIAGPSSHVSLAAKKFETQCPDCGSYDLARTSCRPPYFYYKCRSCNPRMLGRPFSVRR